ncbi:sensor domain-containing diguanylate cyclase [bacterium]|nr:sensor domain-containing diguanylate cyclase [bacterium]
MSKKNIDVLYKISAALNSTSTAEESLNHSFDIMIEYLHIEKIGIFLFNNQKEEFQLSFGKKFSEKDFAEIRSLMRDQWMGLFMNPLEDDYSDCGLYYTDTEGVEKHVYGVPLKHSGNPVGFMLMVKLASSVDEYEFTLEFLEAISGQMSVILHRDSLLKSIMKEKKYIELMYDTSKILTYTHNESKIIDYVLKKISQNFIYNCIGFYTVEDKTHGKLRVSTKGLTEAQREIFLEEMFRKASKELHYFTSELKKNTTVIDYTDQWEESSETEIYFREQSLVTVPFRMGNIINGFFYICNFNSFEYESNKRQVLTTIIYHLASSIEKAREFYKNLKLANTDGLTGIYNHRFFQEIFEKEYQRAKRYKLNLSVIMIDIDFFKKFNDDHGHQTGDRVLESTALMLCEAARNIDTVARYGGEEFVIIMPETSIDGAALFSERIRQKIEENRIKVDDFSLQVTISLGVSCFESSEDSPMSRSHLLELADKALYLSKEKGRNSVSTAKELV